MASMLHLNKCQPFFLSQGPQLCIQVTRFWALASMLLPHECLFFFLPLLQLCQRLQRTGLSTVAFMPNTMQCQSLLPLLFLL